MLPPEKPIEGVADAVMCARPIDGWLALATSVTLSRVAFVHESGRPVESCAMPATTPIPPEGIVRLAPKLYGDDVNVSPGVFCVAVGTIEVRLVK